MSFVGDFFFTLEKYLEGKDDHEVVLHHSRLSRQEIWREIAKIIGWPADKADFSDEEEFPYVGCETHYQRTGYMSSVSYSSVAAGDLRAQCLRALGPMPLPVYEGPILPYGVGAVRCFTLADEGISLHRGEIILGSEGRGRHEERVSVVGAADPAEALLYATVQIVTVRELLRFIPVLTAAESSDERYALVLLNAAGGHRGNVSYTLPDGSVVLATGHLAQGEAGRMGGWDEMLALVPIGTEIRYHTSGGGGHIGGSHWLFVGRDGVRCEDETHRLQRLALEEITSAASATTPCCFNFFTLSGNRVKVGVQMDSEEEPGRLTCYDGYEQALLAVIAGRPATEILERVTVAKDQHDTVVLTPSTMTPDPGRELVLVNEYSPGAGSKRWPSFHIDWTTCPVEKLAEVSRSRGSGSNTSTLVLAPTGWAQNIASQFVNERDMPGQVIGYVAPHTAVAYEATFVPSGGRYFTCRCGAAIRATKSEWSSYERGEAISLACSNCGAIGSR